MDSLKNISENYFNCFNEMKELKQNSWQINVLASLKILSLIFIIPPAFFGIAYALTHRVKEGAPPNENTEGVTDAARNAGVLPSSIIPHENTEGVTDVARDAGVSPRSIIPQENLEIFEKLNEFLQGERSEQALKEVFRLFNQIDRMNSRGLSEELANAYIKLINSIRQPIWENDNKEENRDILTRLNWVSYKFSLKFYGDGIKEHMASIENADEIGEYDGKIGPNSEKGEKILSGKRTWAHLPGYDEAKQQIKVDYEQIPALSQVTGQNQLCSYYALFFLEQFIEGKPLTDRAACNDYIYRRIFEKFQKYLLSYLSLQKEVEFRWRITIDSIALAPGDICQLAKNREFFKNNDQWLVIDQSSVDPRVTPEMSIYPEERRGKKIDFPIRMIKQIDMHYYFVIVDKNEEGHLKFTVAHSLPDAIKSKWSDADWKDLLNSVALLTCRAIA